MESKKILNIENFFSEENEKKGVWFEPVIDGKACGLEFLLIGMNSEEARKETARIKALSDKIKAEDIPDEEKSKRFNELDAEVIAALTKDIRAKNGAELQFKGKTLEFSNEVAKQLYLMSPDLRGINTEFVLKSSNFIIIED